MRNIKKLKGNVRMISLETSLLLNSSWVVKHLYFTIKFHSLILIASYLTLRAWLSFKVY